MYGLSEHTIHQIQQVLNSVPSITGVTLYGSRARGDYRTGSDIDITILGDAISYSDLLSVHTKLDELMLPYSFDISIFSRINNKLLQENILRDGKEFKFAEMHRVDAKTHRVDAKTHRVDEKLHRVKLTKKQLIVIEFCAAPHSSREILAHLKLYYQSRSIKKYVTDLVTLGYLRPIYPDSLNAPTQKYIVVTQE